MNDYISQPTDNSEIKLKLDINHFKQCIICTSTGTAIQVQLFWNVHKKNVYNTFIKKPMFRILIKKN